MIGDIMSISRLRMGTDGSGVTTLVAFFDCPMHCKYCINDYCHDTDDNWESTVPRAAYTPDELLHVLEKDEIYYLMSGGGVTFGGGEPLLQSSFIHEVCRNANPLWKKRLETSLNVPWRNVEPVLDDIDEWIIDVKDINDEIYKKYTGISNNNLRENLTRMRKLIGPSKLHIRVPRIPGYNEEKNIEETIDWITFLFDTTPEVFDYIITQPINYKFDYEYE